MRELQQRQKFKRRLYSTPALVALAVITVFFIRGTYLVFQKKIESQKNVEILQAKVVELNRKQESLTANMEAIDTDAGFEKEVKSKYNVAKEGERVVILVDPKSATTSPDRDVRPWYKRVVDAVVRAF